MVTLKGNFEKTCAYARRLRVCGASTCTRVREYLRIDTYRQVENIYILQPNVYDGGV